MRGSQYPVKVCPPTPDIVVSDADRCAVGPAFESQEHPEKTWMTANAPMKPGEHCISSIQGKPFDSEQMLVHGNIGALLGQFIGQNIKIKVYMGGDPLEMYVIVGGISLVPLMEIMRTRAAFMAISSDRNTEQWFGLRLLIFEMASWFLMTTPLPVSCSKWAPCLHKVGRIHSRCLKERKKLRIITRGDKCGYPPAPHPGSSAREHLIRKIEPETKDEKKIWAVIKGCSVKFSKKETYFDKRTLIGHLCGKFRSYIRGEIGSRVGRNQTTVTRICERWMQEGTTDRHGRSHPPQCTKKQDSEQEHVPSQAKAPVPFGPCLLRRPCPFDNLNYKTETFILFFAVKISRVI
ncbi:hypothetical protein TNCV_3338461 [Trichonephila clavipes]|nr:hypothetical protein TNCV_3338461 [Trichonephila clavipes]